MGFFIGIDKISWFLIFNLLSDFLNILLRNFLSFAFSHVNVLLDLLSEIDFLSLNVFYFFIVDKYLKIFSCSFLRNFNHSLNSSPLFYYEIIIPLNLLNIFINIFYHFLHFKYIILNLLRLLIKRLIIKTLPHIILLSFLRSLHRLLLKTNQISTLFNISDSFFEDISSSEILKQLLQIINSLLFAQTIDYHLSISCILRIQSLQIIIKFNQQIS